MHHSTHQNLFSNIPSNDFLSLFSFDEPKYQEVVKFLKFNKEDVSKATGIPIDSVRYDNRIPQLLQDRIQEWAVLFNLVAGYFKGDGAKTVLWFSTPNPMLGNVSPKNMIRLGRSSKLLKFVVNALSENNAH